MSVSSLQNCLSSLPSLWPYLGRLCLLFLSPDGWEGCCKPQRGKNQQRFSAGQLKKLLGMWVSMGRCERARGAGAPAFTVSLPANLAPSNTGFPCRGVLCHAGWVQQRLRV